MALAVTVPMASGGGDANDSTTVPMWQTIACPASDVLRGMFARKSYNDSTRRATGSSAVGTRSKTTHGRTNCLRGLGGLGDWPAGTLDLFAALAWGEAVERAQELQRVEGLARQSARRSDQRYTSSGDADTQAAFQAVACQPQFSWDCSWAIRTAQCESNFDPNAIGQEWYAGELWYFVGWWQIATQDPALIPALQDPERNTLEAHWKYLHGGISHWPYCGRL